MITGRNGKESEEEQIHPWPCTTMGISSTGEKKGGEGKNWLRLITCWKARLKFWLSVVKLALTRHTSYILGVDDLKLLSLNSFSAFLDDRALKERKRTVQFHLLCKIARFGPKDSWLVKWTLKSFGVHVLGVYTTILTCGFSYSILDILVPDPPILLCMYLFSVQ